MVHFIAQALISLDPPKAVIVRSCVQKDKAAVFLNKNKAIAASQGYLFTMPDPVFTVPRISELFTICTVVGLNKVANKDINPARSF
jgi:hypothetical protein